MNDKQIIKDRLAEIKGYIKGVEKSIESNHELTNIDIQICEESFGTATIALAAIDIVVSGKHYECNPNYSLPNSAVKSGE